MEELRKKAETDAEKEYNLSGEGHLYKQWRKKHPKADADDFSDYLFDKNYDEDNDKHLVKSRKLQNQAYALNKGYVATQAIMGSAMTGITIAPIAGLITKKVTKSGKKGAAVALGIIGTTAVAEAISSQIDRNRAYNELSKQYNVDR